MLKRVQRITDLLSVVKTRAIAVVLVLYNNIFLYSQDGAGESLEINAYIVLLLLSQ